MGDFPHSKEGVADRSMRLMKWMQEGALDVSEIPYRHDRLGLPRRMSWTLGFVLAVLAFICLIAGAILTAIVFTEVRPPTADENYNRYLGSDYRRIIGKTHSESCEKSGALQLLECNPLISQRIRR